MTLISIKIIAYLQNASNIWTFYYQAEMQLNRTEIYNCECECVCVCVDLAIFHLFLFEEMYN